MSINESQWSGILDGVIAQLDTSEPAAMSEAAVCSWEKLAAILIPLLGRFSFYLIYRRSLDLNKSVFPWLPMASRTDTVLDSFVDLRQAFDQQGSADLPRINLALLHTFAELLAALIGERLTTVYLRAAFRDIRVAESTEQKRI